MNGNAEEQAPKYSREEFDLMRIQVDEMHKMMSQLAAIVQQMQGHPMLSAFMPRGL